MAWALSLIFYISLLPWNMAGAVDYWNYNVHNLTGDGGAMSNVRVPADNVFLVSGDNTLSVNSALTAWVNVRAYGAALTDVPIQAALSAIDNTIGAEVFIPRGQYEIGTGLLMQGKNNVTIRGAGKDITILHMDFGTATQPAVYNVTGTWGILSIESNAALDTNVSDIRIEDMTFWLDNTGTHDSGDPTAINRIKNVYFRGVTNITFKNVKIRGSRWEALYTDGNSSSPPTKIRVIDSDFLDTQHNAFNTNTGDTTEVIVDRCFFDNTVFGIQVVGERGIITNNIFKNVNNGIVVAEASYPIASADTRGWIVSGNIITGLGANATTTSSVFGINVNAGDSQFTDNTVDNGIIVSNNSVINSVKRSANAGPLTAFRLAGGNIKAFNNHVSGLTIEAGGSGDTNAYFISKGAANGVARQQVYFSNNTLDNTLFGSLWNQGIMVNGGDNSYYYFSGNVITHIRDTGFALYVPTATGSPYISINGDILNGYIYYPGKFLSGIANPVYINTSGELNNIPIWGDSNGSIGNYYTKELRKRIFTDNATTPSVSNGNIFYTANTGATTITNFTGSIDNKEITIVFTDNVTTVQNNANIFLAGATNFVATPNDALRLMWAMEIGWVEIGRSVN